MSGYSLAGSNATDTSQGGEHIVVAGIRPYQPDKGILDNMTGPPVDPLMRTTHAPVQDDTPILVYVLVPIGSLLLIILVSFLVSLMILKRISILILSAHLE